MTEREEPQWVAPGTGPPAQQPTWPPASGGPSWGPPPSPQVPPRTEGLAVAALVLAIVALLVPILPAIAALVLAATAARRIREAPGGSLGGQGLVTAARAVALIGLLGWVLIGVLAASVVISRDQGPGGPAETDAGLPASREVNVEALEVGHCVEDDTIGDEGAVETVDVLPCREPHDLEVYANVTVPGGGFPGDRELERFADRACVAHFRRYLGIPLRDSAYDYFYYVPSEDSWNAGDRIVTCGVIDPEGDKLTGSLRGARR